MKRNRFIASLVPLAAGLRSFSQVDDVSGEALFSPPMRRPPYLKPGDLIGITSPAGFITPEDLQPAIQQITEWGFAVRLGATIGRRDFTFGGTDEERTRDFQQMLDDPSVKAILCARGGYGAVRIIDRLQFAKFQANPKWIIGFSDITVLHCHLARRFGIASLHSKMCNSFPKDRSLAEPVQLETIDSIRRCLKGEKMLYSAGPHEKNRPGTGEGELVGGNLAIIQNLAGTPSDLPTAGKILFLEEVGEYLYSIDRMLWNLKRAGKLARLKGLIIGGFNRIKADDPGDEFGRTVYDLVLEKVKEYAYPVCFDFPVGHQKNNYALKCGVRHRLELTRETVVLKEI